MKKCKIIVPTLGAALLVVALSCGQPADPPKDSGLAPQDSLNAAKYAEPSSDFPQRKPLSTTGSGPDTLQASTDSTPKDSL